MDLGSDVMYHKKLVGGNAFFNVNNVLSVIGYHERSPPSSINYQHSASNSLPPSGQIPGDLLLHTSLFFVSHNLWLQLTTRPYGNIFCCYEFFSSWRSNGGVYTKHA